MESSRNLQVFLNKNVAEYIDEAGILNDGTWATETEILATASLLKTDIMIYGTYGSSMKWLCFPASLSLDTLSQDAMFLSNESGTHFDVVLSA